MSYIQKRDGKYRARYKDPLGKTLSRTFARKADAQRFLLDFEADRVGGRWVDPRDADMPGRGVGRGVAFAVPPARRAHPGDLPA